MGKPRVTFDDISPLPTAGGDERAINALRFVIKTESGASCEFDFTGLPGTALAHRLVTGLELWLNTRRFLKPKYVHSAFHVSVLSQIVRALDAAGVKNPGALDAATHDAVVEPLLWSRYADQTARVGLRMLHEALGQLDASELHPSMPGRLQYQTHRTKDSSTPRDAYSRRERTMLRKACLVDMDAILRRFSVEADALLAQGGDPRGLRDPLSLRLRAAAQPSGPREPRQRKRSAGKAAIRAAIERLVASPPNDVTLTHPWLGAQAGVHGHTVARNPDLFAEFVARMQAAHPDLVGRKAPATMWLSLPHLAWELNEHGPMTKAEMVRRSLGRVRLLLFPPAVRAIFPTAEELLPFQIYLQLEAGLPPDGCYHLNAECLEPTGPGVAKLRYYKGRARRTITEGVGTETLASAGGAVRAVLKITERLRRHAAPELRGALWICVSAEEWGTVNSNVTPHANAVARFVKRHDLTHDDGTPFRFVAAKLRKTHRATAMEAMRGAMDALGDDHSESVALKHYGNIPALRPMHQATVESAAHDALDAALRITVVPPDAEEHLLGGAPAGKASVAKAATRVLRVLQHPEEHDVFLAGCLDFFDSPWARRKGDGCPVATWRCLECDNAVVLQRHLPRLLAFQGHLLREREVLEGDVWRLKYGDAHDRIVSGILPRFPQSAIEQARAIASVDLLTWLPPELRTSQLARRLTSTTGAP